jgi:aminomethyltransferase
MAQTLRQSPLNAVHIRLGAKLVDFGGWNMPVSYPSGTIAEHMACRESAAIFDVSHLGTVRLGGPDALGTLQYAFTNDLNRIAPGETQYTHMLDDEGSVIDDLIVWWIDDQQFDVVANASNTTPVTDAIGGEDVTSTRAVIAIQGPAARAITKMVFPEAAEVAHNRVKKLHWEGHDVTVAGTGYTGEDGVELAVAVDGAEDLWNALQEAGAKPAGLGARDTLRLEAGLPLHGHELGPGITSLQASLGWVLAWDKGDFRGRSALDAEKANGLKRRLRGLLCDGRQPPRAGNEVFTEDSAVGVITSGNYAPVLGRGIALGLLSPDVKIGAKVHVDVRGRRIDAEVVKLPFVQKRSV